jgi:DNA ligase 1
MAWSRPTSPSSPGWRAAGPRPTPATGPRLRPFMLAHPIEDADWPTLEPSEFVAEWKWDGIRVQLAAGAGEICLFSRGGDDVSAAFPDLVEAFAGLDVVADGELLVVRDGAVMPFNDLQQRLNRKTVTPRMLEQHPAHLRLYDLLVADGEDLRPLPFVERRRRLETWHGDVQPPRSDLSELIAFHSFEELDALWAGARARQLEGLMLKRKSSPYVAGRTRGHWFKWKRDPLTLDCVLMYAQRGSGKRSSYYSDYTFGLWRGDELVPVGKSYFGFTDEELLRLDRFIRGHTSERFGPVRAVEPRLVLEVAFDAVQPSSRHKSGLAMRFPRIHRIRWDKPAGEADRLETLAALVEK